MTRLITNSKSRINEALVAGMEAQIGDNNTRLSTILEGSEIDLDQFAEVVADYKALDTAQAVALAAADVLLQTQITNNDTDIVALQTQITSNDATDVALQTQITNNDTDVVALQAQITANGAEHTGLQTQITNNDTDIVALQVQITSNDATDVALQTQITNNDTDIVALQVQITSNDATDIVLQDQITNNDTDIVTLQANINVTTGNITTNASNISSNDNDIAANTTAIGGNDTDIAAINTKLGSRTAANLATLDTTESLTTQLASKGTASGQSTNTANIAANLVKIESNDGDIATNLASINTINGDNATQTELDVQTGRINTNITAIALNTAKDGVTGAQATAITANSAKVGISSGQASAIVDNTAKVTYDGAVQVAANATSITNNDSDIVALQTQITANDATDVALQTQITNNDSDIVALQTQITANDATDVTLQTQITNNDTDIVTLQAQIHANDTDIAANVTAIALNTAKDGISSGQTSSIANHATLLSGSSEANLNSLDTTSSLTTQLGLLAPKASPTITTKVRLEGFLEMQHTVGAAGADAIIRYDSALLIRNLQATPIEFRTGDVKRAEIDHSGNFDITGQYEINGTQIASSNLSNDSNIPKLDATDNEFTGNLKIMDRGSLRLFESTTNGTSKTSLKACASLASHTTFVFPPDNGDNLDVLQSDGSGNTTWVAAAGGGLEPYTIIDTISTDQNNPTMLTKNIEYLITHPTVNSNYYISIQAHGNHVAGDTYRITSVLNYGAYWLFPSHNNNGASGTQRLHNDGNRYNTTNNSQFYSQNKRTVVICSDITSGVENWVELASHLNG